MDATRPRLTLADAIEPRARLSFEAARVSPEQWVVTALLVALAVLVAWTVAREVRFAPRPFDRVAEPPATVVPRDAVSVRSLAVAAGRSVRVGEPRLHAIKQLGSMPLLRRTEEPGPLGTREVRSYQDVTLVFEPFERAGAARVAAIYVQ